MITYYEPINSDFIYDKVLFAYATSERSAFS